VQPSPEGWTELRLPAAGLVRVRQVVPFGSGSSCPT
jgi:hypothetical protein